MPTLNSEKKYVAGGIYHVYNRAGGRNKLFKRKQDYEYFLSALNKFLVKNPAHPFVKRNFMDCIKIHAYCLMPTHFHLLLQQEKRDSMPRFMKSLQLSYTYYKKQKDGWRGHLYESRYKARLIKSEEDLINLSKYIHRNPQELRKNLEKYKYSSFRAYLYNRVKNSFKMSFLTTDLIFSYFNYSPSLYKKYILEVSPLESVPSKML